MSFGIWLRRPGVPDTDLKGRWEWLSDYQPDAPVPLMTFTGKVETSPDSAKAMAFQTREQAMACWRRQSRAQPYLDSGEENRPLMTYTIQIKKLPEPQAS